MSPQHPLEKNNDTGDAQFYQLDTAVRVETPEKIAFQYQTVGPFRRLMAYGLDIVFVGLLFIGICLLVFLLFTLLAYVLSYAGAGRVLADLAESSIGMLLVIGAAAFWFYGAVCETLRNGQTFGKSVAHIRVISEDGSAIDGVQAMIRNLFRLLDIMPVMPATLFFVFDSIDDAPSIPLFLIGLLCMMMTPKFQRIGDLVAGTMVVLVEREWAPELAKFSDPRVAQLAELIPNDFVVTPSMAKALASFVESTARLGPSHSHEIASRLAFPLMVQFGFPRDTDCTLLLCALYYKTFSQFNGTDAPPHVDVVASDPPVAAAVL